MLDCGQGIPSDDRPDPPGGTFRPRVGAVGPQAAAPTPTQGREREKRPAIKELSTEGRTRQLVDNFPRKPLVILSYEWRVLGHSETFSEHDVVLPDFALQNALR